MEYLAGEKHLGKVLVLSKPYDLDALEKTLNHATSLSGR
jgi:hypothetical protein